MRDPLSEEALGREGKFAAVRGQTGQSDSAGRVVARPLTRSAPRKFDARRHAFVGEDAHASQSVGKIPDGRALESARNCDQACGTPA